mgnify:CR=1 FL=1
MTSAAHNTAKAWPAVEDQTLQIRIDLAAAYRLIHRLGLDDSIYTHISVRLPGRNDRFLINPYGLRFEEVTASNLVTVDLEQQQVRAGERCYGFDVPPLRKEALRSGLDDLGLILRRREAISRFEQADRIARPWAHLEAD